jgi:TatD DNase family protein
MISDAHAHLDMSQFDEDREEVIQRALAAGLKWIVNICMIGDGAEEAYALVEKHPALWAMAGCHPHDAKDFFLDDLARLEDLASQEKVVGIGEIGLDFHRDYSPRSDQEQVFAAQLDLARRLKLPVAIHDRNAHQPTLDLIKEAGRGVKGLFHCFSGDVAMARRLLDLGFYISIPGVVTFPKAQITREVAAFVPLDRLLVETDCPFLAPIPHRGRRNEPAFVKDTAQAVAEIRNLDYEELAARTTANLERLLKLSSGRPESAGTET